MSLKQTISKFYFFIVQKCYFNYSRHLKISKRPPYYFYIKLSLSTGGVFMNDNF